MTVGHYKSVNSLMRHIRESAGISIGGSRDKHALARMGYFHGYKGYRYVGDVSRCIPYTTFDELRAVVEFDTRVKWLLYPVLMDLEMAMKNLALVEILDAAQSSALTDIYANLMPGNRIGGRAGKLAVMHENGAVLLAAYKRGNAIAKHYYDGPNENVPVWALFELITMGAFAGFLQQLSDGTLARVAESWGMKRRDADLMPHLVFALTDLRNCVAHNGVVFDARFAKSRSVRRQVKDLVSREMGLADGKRLMFETITDYFVLVVLLASSTGWSRRQVRSLVTDYGQLSEALWSHAPANIFGMIVHTDHRPKLEAVRRWAANR